MPRGIYNHKRKSENKDQGEVPLDLSSKIVIAPPINDNDGEMLADLDHVIEIARMQVREMALIVEELEVLRGKLKGKG